MIKRVYKSLKPRLEPITDGVTTFEETWPSLEFEEFEVCDTCNERECECKVEDNKR